MFVVVEVQLECTVQPGRQVLVHKEHERHEKVRLPCPAAAGPLRGFCQSSCRPPEARNDFLEKKVADEFGMSFKKLDIHMDRKQNKHKILGVSLSKKSQFLTSQPK